METLSIGPPPADSAVEVYRQDSVVGSFAAAAMLVGVAVAFGFGALRCFDQPLLMMLLAAPFMGFAAFITLALAGVMFQVARSSTRPTNWLAALSEDSLYLNLRAARNAQQDRDESTVLRFTSDEIVSVGRLREIRREAQGNRQQATTVNYIELHVSGCEPGEIEIPIEVEREREGVPQRFIGVEIRGTHQDVPAFSVEPDRLRIKWNARLFEALGTRFEIAQPRDVDLSALMEAMSPEGRVRALAIRGQRMQAMLLARRELGLRIGPAKALVASVMKDAA